MTLDSQGPCPLPLELITEPWAPVPCSVSTKRKTPSQTGTWAACSPTSVPNTQGPSSPQPWCLFQVPVGWVLKPDSSQPSSPTPRRGAGPSRDCPWNTHFHFSQVLSLHQPRPIYLLTPLSMSTFPSPICSPHAARQRFSEKPLWPGSRLPAHHHRGNCPPSRLHSHLQAFCTGLSTLKPSDSSSPGKSFLIPQVSTHSQLLPEPLDTAGAAAGLP